MRVSVCVLLQVVLVFCLWSTDVSRAYVFQASRPEGGDNPPAHTKGEIRRIFSCLVGSDPNAWKRLFAINVQTTLKKARGGAVSSPCEQNAFLRLNFDFVPVAG